MRAQLQASEPMWTSDCLAQRGQVQELTNEKRERHSYKRGGRLKSDKTTTDAKDAPARNESGEPGRRGHHYQLSQSIRVGQSRVEPGCPDTEQVMVLKASQKSASQVRFCAMSAVGRAFSLSNFVAFS